MTGGAQVQLDEAPIGELPRVELGASGAGVVADGCRTTGTDVWPTGEFSMELKTGEGMTAAEELGTTAGVVVTGAGLLVGTIGMMLVVTYGEVVAGQFFTVEWQLVMVTSTVW